MIIQQQVALAPLTTLGVGGPARYFAEATTAAEVSSALDYAASCDLPLFVLGGGSNLLISDQGFNGLVLKIALTGIDQHARNDDGKVLFQAGAGESWDALVARAVQANCAGIECLSGIPGTVGGTPVQNVGAYGQEVSETITEVLALDRQDGQLHSLCNSACEFAYRSSIFNQSQKGHYIVLRVTYALQPGGTPHLEYRDLKHYFSGFSGEPTLRQVRDAVRDIRRGKAMLIIAGDEDCRSAGSFFKNPLLDRQQYAELLQRLAPRSLQAPCFPASAPPAADPAAGPWVKIPAAWLVEQAGFSKGFTRGPVGISRKHALAIVNRGGARAADVIALKNEIQARVEGEFGIRLQPEPVLVGFEDTAAAREVSP